MQLQMQKAMLQKRLLEHQAMQQQMLSQVGESGKPRYTSYPPVGGVGTEEGKIERRGALGGIGGINKG